MPSRQLPRRVLAVIVLAGVAMVVVLVGSAGAVDADGSVYAARSAGSVDSTGVALDGQEMPAQPDVPDDGCVSSHACGGAASCHACHPHAVTGASDIAVPADCGCGHGVAVDARPTGRVVGGIERPPRLAA